VFTSSTALRIWAIVPPLLKAVFSPSGTMGNEVASGSKLPNLPSSSVQPSGAVATNVPSVSTAASKLAFSTKIEPALAFPATPAADAATTPQTSRLLLI
jgi:hypothetical protein